MRWLEDPYTGQPSIAFTLYAMEREGDLRLDDECEEEEYAIDDDYNFTPRGNF